MEQEVDKWIEQLADCKQLSEDNVKKLCEKVRTRLACHSYPRHRLIYMRYVAISLDPRIVDGGIKCTASEMSRYRLRRHPRTVCMCPRPSVYKDFDIHPSAPSR